MSLHSDYVGMIDATGCARFPHETLVRLLVRRQHPLDGDGFLADDVRGSMAKRHVEAQAQVAAAAPPQR